MSREVASTLTTCRVDFFETYVIFPITRGVGREVGRCHHGGVAGSIDPMSGFATAPTRLRADFLMHRVFGGRWVLALWLLASGCQVCQITDCWNDGVDHFAECEPQLDCWYHPHCDLTREYRPDGGDHWLFRRCGCEGRTCR